MSLTAPAISWPLAQPSAQIKFNSWSRAANCSLFTPSSSLTLHRNHRRTHCRCEYATDAPRRTPDKYEIRICTNKTCKKQGSQQVLKFAEDLALQDLSVRSCGCLGGCGNGPNMVVLPLEVTLNHIGTPSRFAEALRAVCDLDVGQGVLQATQLRLTGNAEARDGNLQGAVDCYTQTLVRKHTQALELGVLEGRHLLYANRAGARLALGDKTGALQDADAAASCAPPAFTTAYIRQVEAHAALEQYAAAADVLTRAAERTPQFSNTPEFKSMTRQLSQVLRQKQAVR